MPRILAPAKWLVALGLLTVLFPRAALAQGRIPASAQQQSQVLTRLALAAQDRKDGRWSQALSNYQSILAELQRADYPPQVRWQAFDGYGLTLLDIQDEEGAVHWLGRARDEARAAGPHDLCQATFDLAFAHAQADDLKSAIKEYQAALAIEPQNTEVLLELGSVYRRAHKYREGERVYEQLLALEPQNARAWGNYGNLFLDQKNVARAVECFEKAAQFAGEEQSDQDWAAQNFLNAGFFHFARKEYEKALPLYERARLIAPENPKVYADIGWARLGLHQKDEAIIAFDQALALDPSADVRELVQLGLSMARSEKK